MWLHRSAALKQAGVGSAVGQPVGTGGEVWMCDGDEALKALQAGMATEDDFLLVRGFCLWLKVPSRCTHWTKQPCKGTRRITPT